MAGQGSKQISNGRAVLMGTLWVNIPVLLIFVLGAVIPAVFSALAHDKLFAFLNRYPLLGPVWLVGTFIGAWMWWSFNVPKWRIWALRRVPDWLSLEQEAINVGLIWDERTLLGRIFSRTEIWSRKDRNQEADLRLKHPSLRR